MTVRWVEMGGDDRGLERWSDGVMECWRKAHPLYRVLQCYIAWPAYTKSRSRVLHRVLQSATRGATNQFRGQNAEFRMVDQTVKATDEGRKMGQKDQEELHGEVNGR